MSNIFEKLERRFASALPGNFWKTITGITVMIAPSIFGATDILGSIIETVGLAITGVGLKDKSDKERIIIEEVAKIQTMLRERGPDPLPHKVYIEEGDKL